MSPTLPDLRSRLKATVQDLRYVTEIDAPFEVVEWPLLGWPASDMQLRKWLGAGDEPVQTMSLEQFFRGQIEDADPNDRATQELVPRFRKLRGTLTELLDAPIAVRVGDAKLKLYVVGGYGDGAVGLATRGLET